uniref:C-type lectin domain-containing protein n=1 Tax=Oreochromis aureus TaxID=47969 RepID=A0AAZ1Y183_OREAU
METVQCKAGECEASQRNITTTITQSSKCRKTQSQIYEARIQSQTASDSISSSFFTNSFFQSCCTQTHTDLASIENTEEMKQLNSTVSPAAHSSELWIGLYSQISWRWSDGFTASGADYRNWDTSEYEADFSSWLQFCFLFRRKMKSFHV